MDPSGTLPLGTLLNQYPQFNGDFEALMIEEASSWYNALQIRFQKRTTHHISFEGSYTISKATDDSSAGRNNWVGALGNGIPQQLDRLYREHSIGGNDTPQRLAAAVVVDLPIGRKQWIGSNINRAVDAVVGGWSLSTIITEQAGQPIALAMSNARLANGTQRPEVVCSQFKTGTSVHSAALTWQNVAGVLIGAVVGLAAWLAYRPYLESDAHHVIGVFQLPWLVIGVAMVLAERSRSWPPPGRPGPLPGCPSWPPCPDDLLRRSGSTARRCPASFFSWSPRSCSGTRARAAATVVERPSSSSASSSSSRP